MASKALPSPEVLRQLLRYEPDTGKLFWLQRSPEMFKDGSHSAGHECARWNSRYAGTEALTSLSADGYRSGAVLSVSVITHRVIWAMQSGSWPDKHIDHINGDPADNRWCNLREATISQNCQNRRKPNTNTSGIRGVSWHKTQRKWCANIKLAGKAYYLGSFDTKDAAGAAYAAASANLHGEFGRLD